MRIVGPWAGSPLIPTIRPPRFSPGSSRWRPRSRDESDDETVCDPAPRRGRCAQGGTRSWIPKPRLEHPAHHLMQRLPDQPVHHRRDAQSARPADRGWSQCVGTGANGPPAAPMATVLTLSGRAGMPKNDTERAPANAEDAAFRSAVPDGDGLCRAVGRRGSRPLMRARETTL